MFRALLFLGAFFSSISLNAKVLVITHSFNRPDFIELQAKTFQRFLQDEYEFVVFNDARDKVLRKQIKKMCAKLNIRHVRIPQVVHMIDRRKAHVPSVRTANAIQYSLDVLGFAHDDIVMIIDSDMFLVRPFSVRRYLQDHDIARVPQCRGHVSYMWNGLIFLNMPKLPDKRSLNMSCGVVEGEQCDSGGHTYFYLKDHPTLRMLDLHPFPLDTLTAQQRQQLPARVQRLAARHMNMEFFIDYAFLHYRGGGNWNHRSARYHKRKTALLREFIAAS